MVRESDDSEDEEGMKKMTQSMVNIKLTEESQVPKKGTEESAAYDLRSSKRTMLEPGTITMVDLKLKLELPPGYFMKLYSRSGLALKGILTVAGVIDSDYRGPVRALLYNSTQQQFCVEKGQRITQAVILPVLNVQWTKEDGINHDTKRGEGGFGSTDVNPQ